MNLWVLAFWQTNNDIFCKLHHNISKSSAALNKHDTNMYGKSFFFFI